MPALTFFHHRGNRSGIYFQFFLFALAYKSQFLCKFAADIVTSTLYNYGETTEERSVQQEQRVPTSLNATRDLLQDGGRNARW